MNNKIKELAEQCQIEEYNSAGDLVEFGFDYEKFAELIVLECSMVMKNVGDYEAAAEIELHFEI